MARKSRRKNFKVSAWFLPVAMSVGLLAAGGILLYKSHREKAKAVT